MEVHGTFLVASDDDNFIESHLLSLAGFRADFGLRSIDATMNAVQFT